MLHLKSHNLLIQKTLSEAIEANSNGTPLTLDRIVSDFDYTIFHISNQEGNKTILLLSIKTKAWVSIQKIDANNGLLPYLQSKYQPFAGISVSQSAEPGYDFTLVLDLASLTNESVVESSLLKTAILSFPFQLAFQESFELSKLPAPEDGSSIDSQKLYNIQNRDDEQFFIKASNDRVTVIFETIFQDETDKILGKVFLQEFVDARKRNRSIQSAPQVLVSNEPPLELQSFTSSRNPQNDASRRFITFVLFPRHFQTAELQHMSISQLTLFRNYFHYHIKCSKAYMHSRMRYRVDSFVKVLNRAKLDEDKDGLENDNQSTRRTITGRKMVY
ncbi:hypothetical protein TPHA_0H02340 [Tetrapisispora phaffii CBS 4417]|uniref:Arp2/3 complex 34 kDa subunit n=1 Tax=Tetrapisispora phaffii (strain ATCC 24235 / CBS 4417 / NBRC 1672 / NRRL Y-8282 / UCD 70-5) TaxID=1071381 RepID=G8BWI7_TETPH|nr:hypothetical protein TPHA_0H02340 [Tetrapisispora phaffii CBS 4417]CCE64438.1 hypothetical protein TPHA_0H02340 [Tetrapisispora phaffii CBS 4417]